MSVGFIQSDMEPGGEIRRKQYECDVTYGTNSEFGFDFLHDNMKERRDLQGQGRWILRLSTRWIRSHRQARTPLIISGSAHDDAPSIARPTLWRGR